MTSFGAALRGRPGLDGAMRFDPPRDLEAVVALLQEGFGDELEEHDRRWLAELTAMSAGTRAIGLFLRFLPAAADSFSGFVHYADGRLVGNVTLLRRPDGAWIIANVVTAPEARRRGIGRELMRMAIAEADRRGARTVVLQVRSSNAPAIALYRDLGFERTGATHTLSLRSVRLAAGTTARADLRPPMRAIAWRRSEDSAVHRLVARSGGAEPSSHLGLVRRELNRHRWRHRIDDWLKMRRSVRVLIGDGLDARAAAVATITDGDSAHRVEFVLDPAQRAAAAAAVVTELLRALRAEPDRPIDALVESDQPELVARLQAEGFAHVKTLDRMVLRRGGAMRTAARAGRDAGGP